MEQERVSAGYVGALEPVGGGRREEYDLSMLEELTVRRKEMLHCGILIDRDYNIIDCGGEVLTEGKLTFKHKKEGLQIAPFLFGFKVSYKIFP